MGVVTIVWIVIGFSLAFGVPTSRFAGDPSTYPMMDQVDGSPLTYTKNGTVHVTAAAIPGIAFAGYQGMFAVITPALMTGAFADRLRFAPYLVFIAVWLVLVYCPVCHWVWGPEGWLKEWGVFDFAGGIVVHATAGFGTSLSRWLLVSLEHPAGVPPTHTHTPPTRNDGARDTIISVTISVSSQSRYHAASISIMLTYAIPMTS